MWIYTKYGFFSAVLHYDKTQMIVRARTRADMDALAAFIEKIGFAASERKIIDTPANDYYCRIFMQPATWTAVVAMLASDIDYSNFKNTVHGDADRDAAYMDVWTIMRRFQDKVAMRQKRKETSKKKGRIAPIRNWFVPTEDASMPDPAAWSPEANDDDEAEFITASQTLPGWSSVLVQKSGAGLDWDDWDANEVGLPGTVVFFETNDDEDGEGGWDARDAGLPGTV